jgi:ADP-heptose:LPS heptosyltransferase
MDIKMDKINYDYLKLAGEMPLLLKTSLIKNKKIIENPKKILIINTCLIGDFILSLPALEQFIKKNKAKIDLIVSPPTKDIAEKIKGVNKVYTATSIHNRNIENENKNNIGLQYLKKQNYDLILVLRISKEAYELLKIINPGYIKTSLRAYTKFTVHLIKNLFFKSHPKQYIKFVFEMLGGEYKNIRFKEIFNFTKEDYNKIGKLQIMQGKEKKILIHTSAHWSMKLWDIEKWAELINKINKLRKFKFIFIGSKEDIKDIRKIQSMINFKTYSLAGKIKLSDLLLVMRLSDYFIGIDSGPRHMASMMDLRSICLLGQGLKFHMPINEKDKVICKSDCNYCTGLFCYRKKTCMQKINVEDVYEEFKKLIK